MRPILCISDDNAAKPDVCGALERSGFPVVREDNIHSALVFLASGVSVGLVVLDIRDCVPDDNSSLHSVKRAAPHIPVIALSHRRSVFKCMHARYLGVSEYLHMPVSERDLLSLVERATAGQGGKLSNEAAPKTAEYGIFVNRKEAGHENQLPGLQEVRKRARRTACAGDGHMPGP